LIMPDLVELTRQSSAPLLEVPALVGQLLGELVFAVAAVGLGMGRGWRETFERLGLTGLRPHFPIVAALGLAAVTGVNFGMEWLERTQFHELWLRDQEMVRMMAAHLSLGATIVLGLSAGIGEEVMVRGALQPRTGLFWAALLFAAGHVQYTWFGMLTILALGLTLGLIRRVSNTTTVIVVHMLYDIVAALGAK
jgi:membrane protease YdiL (CAAX protease family)